MNYFQFPDVPFSLFPNPARVDCFIEKVIPVCEPLIELNHRPYPWREGATVAAVMAENGYDFSHIIVKINGTVIEEDLWPTAKIAAGDDVEMIHVFGGG